MQIIHRAALINFLQLLECIPDLDLISLIPVTSTVKEVSHYNLQSICVLVLISVKRAKVRTFMYVWISK